MDTDLDQKVRSMSDIRMPKFGVFPKGDAPDRPPPRFKKNPTDLNAVVPAPNLSLGPRYVCILILTSSVFCCAYKWLWIFIGHLQWPVATTYLTPGRLMIAPVHHLLVPHGPDRYVDPFLCRGIPISSDLSDFPLANSCGNGTYVFKISWMCVSRLENCNISGVECGKIEFLKKPSHISIAFSDYLLVYSKKFSMWKSVVFLQFSRWVLGRPPTLSFLRQSCVGLPKNGRRRKTTRSSAKRW
jgi:hypothetical protein